VRLSILRDGCQGVEELKAPLIGKVCLMVWLRVVLYLSLALARPLSCQRAEGNAIHGSPKLPAARWKCRESCRCR